MRLNERYLALCISTALFAHSAVSHANTTGVRSEGVDNDSVTWLLQQVRVGEAQNNLPVVEDALERLSHIAPRHPEVACAQFRFDFVAGRRDVALSHLAPFADDTPLPECISASQRFVDVVTNEKAALTQAQLLAKAARYEEALVIYQDLFRGQFVLPEYAFQYTQWLAGSDKDPEIVKRAFQRLMQSAPNTPRFEVAYAGYLLDINPQDDSAIAILERHAQSDEASRQALNIWINALSDWPASESSRFAYERMLASYSQDSFARLAFDDFETRLAAQKTLEKDPGYIAFTQAVALREDEKYDAARSLFLQAIKKRPNDPDIYGEYGVLLLRMGDNGKAQYYFNRAAKLADNEAATRWQELSVTAQFWGLISRVKTALEKEQYPLVIRLLNSAEQLEESPATVMQYRAELALKKGELAQAQRIYQNLLKADALSLPALRGMLEMVIAKQDIQVLNRFVAGLTGPQSQLLDADLRSQSSRLYRALAEDHDTRGELDDAIAKLERAISLDPTNHWAYFDLASIYEKRGQAELGESVFKKALWRFPLEPQLRYAHALYLRGLDKNAEALESLGYVPPKKQDDDIIALKESLKGNLVLSSAKGQDSQSARRALLQLLQSPNLSATLEAQIASELYDLGDVDTAITRLGSALNREQSLAPYWHMTYGSWLIAQRRFDEARTWQASYRLPAYADDDEQAQYQRLELDYLLATTPPAQLAQNLSAFAARNPNNDFAKRALLDYYISARQFMPAYEVYQSLQGREAVLETPALIDFAAMAYTANKPILGDTLVDDALNQLTPDEVYLQQRLMGLLDNYKTPGRAINVAETLLMMAPTSPELALDAGDLAKRLGYEDEANRYYQMVVTREEQQALARARARANQTSNTEQNAEVANSPWYVNSAQSNLRVALEKEQGHVAIAVNFAGQTSTQSDAELTAGWIPAEVYFPLWDGHGFVKTDFGAISAETTDFTSGFQSARYGTGLFCFPNCQWLAVTPKDRGFDLGIGWQNDTWRVDIGTTPFGFIQQDLVGGIIYQGSFGDFSYDIDLERRAVGDSVLSYSGLVDVDTGNVWGGVRRTGLTLGLYHDKGEAMGFWSTLDYQLFTGREVKDNTRFRLMGGGYYRLIQSVERELTVGANLLHWQYAENLSEQTYGHGGYYSPQSYLGLSIPATYDGRLGDDFIYRIEAGVSFSQTITDDSDFFPEHPELQAQALAISDDTGVNPVFEGGNSSGVSYRFGGQFEYRITPYWFVGGSFQIDRADFYEPNFGQLFLRYQFKPINYTLPFSPRLVTPYIDF